MNTLKKIDTDRPVRTDLGRKAKIVSTSISGDFPIAVVVTYYEDLDKSYDIVVLFDIYGVSKSFTRLYNVPTKQEGWINLYSTGNAYVTMPNAVNGVKIGSVQFYSKKETAEQNILDTEEYIATVKVEWEV